MLDIFDAYAIQPSMTLNGKKFLSTKEGIFFSIIFYFLSSLVLIYNFYNVYKENNPIVLQNLKLLNESEVFKIPKEAFEFGITLVRIDQSPNIVLRSVKHHDLNTINLVGGQFSGIYSISQQYKSIFEQNVSLSGNFTECGEKYKNFSLLSNSYCTNYKDKLYEIGGNIIDGTATKSMNVYMNHHYCDLVFDDSVNLKYDIPKEYDSFLKLINKQNLTISDKEYIDSLNLQPFTNISDLNYIYPFPKTPYFSNEKAMLARAECLKLFSNQPPNNQNLTNSTQNIRNLLQNSSFIYAVSFENKILNTDLFEGYENIFSTKYFEFSATEESLFINVKLTKNTVITDDNLFFQFGDNRVVEFYEVSISEERRILDRPMQMYLPIQLNFSLNEKIVNVNRSYNKIDTVLANCFSIIKVFYSVLFFCMVFIEEKLVYKEIIKSIYFERDSNVPENSNVNIMQRYYTDKNKIVPFSNKILKKNYHNGNNDINNNQNINVKNSNELKIDNNNHFDIEIDNKIENNSKLKLMDNEIGYLKNDGFSNINNIKKINDLHQLMENFSDSKKKENKNEKPEENHLEQQLSNRINPNNLLDSDLVNVSATENENLNIGKKNNSCINFGEIKNNIKENERELNQLELSQNNIKNSNQNIPKKSKEKIENKNEKVRSDSYSIKNSLHHTLNIIKESFFLNKKVISKFNSSEALTLFDNLCDELQMDGNCSQSKINPINIDYDLYGNIKELLSCINPCNDVNIEKAKKKKFDNFLISLISLEYDIITILKKTIQHDYLMNDYYFKIHYFNREEYNEYNKNLHRKFVSNNDNFNVRIFNNLH